MPGKSSRATAQQVKEDLAAPPPALAASTQPVLQRRSPAGPRRTPPAVRRQPARRHRRRRRRAPTSRWTSRTPFWSALSPRTLLACCSRRARTRTSAPPAPAATTPAPIRRAQRRGSRRGLGSQPASSSTAASVRTLSRRSSRSVRSPGGSTGTSAYRSSRSTSVIGSVLLDLRLQLLDRAVQQHFRRTLGSTERARDLAVVHSEREAHDQSLAAVVRQRRNAREHLLELLAALDQRLGVVRRRHDRGVLELGLRPTRAVAVVVGGQVVGDPDQPWPQRSPVRLALRTLEVPVGLEERLLGQVLGVVMVARAVVAVAVDVSQVGAVQLGEVAVEPGLVHDALHTWSLRSRVPLRPLAATRRGRPRSNAAGRAPPRRAPRAPPSRVRRH